MKRELYRFEFEIPALPDLAVTQKRKHWRVVQREADKWRTLVVAYARRQRPSVPLLHARVTLIRRSAREPDYDNMVYSFKPIIDALCRTELKRNKRGRLEVIERADILFDDAPEVLRRHYLHEKVPRKKGSVVVRIEELDDG